MDKFPININFTGVCHKKTDDGFFPIHTFSDGFVFNLECEEEEVSIMIEKLFLTIEKFFQNANIQLRENENDVP